MVTTKLINSTSFVTYIHHMEKHLFDTFPPILNTLSCSKQRPLTVAYLLSASLITSHACRALLLISNMIMGPNDLQGQCTGDKGCVCVCVYICILPLITTYNGAMNSLEQRHTLRIANMPFLAWGHCCIFTQVYMVSCSQAFKVKRLTCVLLYSDIFRSFL